ncbi:hypothetical protein [Pseudonocardia oroxyli]|uniref:Uncharacterized protein n=1 Tax=Pseudonocardia oroxyli TaxID=366584 RepID=A0A1G7L8B3_PSEOR|nr:hypothetical protein [Pseudonocardia oroxyli]SDF45616.1 hypothetical protein SAMN05216377_10512 [Pseudonocardia oroxyli]
MLEGAGIVSSVADVLGADGAVGLGAAGVGLALDAVDFASDPLGEFTSAGFGWLIEHVSWLREPLDALAGDPGAITAAAAGWGETADMLRRESAGRGAAPAWEGRAAQRYAEAERALGDRLAEAADRADAVAQRIVLAGLAVGTVRALVRDAIADFLAAAVRWLVATLATSGVGLPALIVSVVQEALVLAGRAALRLEDLLATLALESAGLLRDAGVVRELVSHLPVRDAAVEWTKQASTAPFGAGPTTSPDG